VGLSIGSDHEVRHDGSVPSKKRSSTTPSGSSKASAAHPPAWGAETRFFYDLTPERTLDAVESTGLRCTGRVFPLNSMENRVLALELEDPLPGTSTTYVVAKFYRPGRWTLPQILEEHAFLFDLQRAELPTVAPLGREGKTVHTMEDTGLFFSIVPRVGGRNPDELDDEALERTGRLLGRIHQVGATRDAGPRLVLGPDTYGTASLEFLLTCSRVPASAHARLERAGRDLIAQSRPWFSACRMQRIHGDAHLGNLLWTPQGPMWVDFDDMAMGPPIQDLWLLTAGRDEENLRRRDVLLRGYCEFADFDFTTLRLIEPLRAFRHLHFAAWIAKRWEDPAFPRAFPFFDSPNYWMELTQDVEECLETMTTMP
jgi:Ser/Thr protein kinase RdoA (MazF antagonist)